MEKISWLRSGNMFKPIEGSFETIDNVPCGVYNIGLSMTGWFINKFADKFTFNYKLYDLQNSFCDYVIKTYNKTKGNFGVMFTGTKGTGKTVTAKVLANRLGLPIIIVKNMDENNQGMIEFINQFNFDCVLFFDEFEKQFDEDDSTILQIMDGVYNSKHRKIFLLTTNNLDVNENLIGRPSRIRYVKKFGNLPLSVVNMYLDDNLKIPEARKEVLDYIGTLSISTIDILKTIVEEVNIHGSINKSKDFFNVSTLKYTYSAIRACLDYGYFYTNLNICTIEQFIKDVNKFKFHIVRPDCLDVDKSLWTEEDKKKVAQWRELRTRIFNDLKYSTIEIDNRFSNIKIGDTLGNNKYESVIKIDEKNHVIITRDDDDYIFFYYITNPDAKPSLFSDDIDLIY